MIIEYTDEMTEGAFYDEISQMLKTCFENDERPDKSVKPIEIKRENKTLAILYDPTVSAKILSVAFIYLKDEKTIKIIGVCSSILGSKQVSKKENKSYTSLLIDDIVKKYKNFKIELSVYIYNSYFIKAYNLYKRKGFILREYNKDRKEFDMFYMPLKIQFNPVTSIQEWISHLDNKDDKDAYNRMIRIIADALHLYDVDFDKIWKIFIELEDENIVKKEYLDILLKYEPKLSEKLKSFEKPLGLKMAQANNFNFIFKNTDNQTLKDTIKELVNDFPSYMKNDFSFKVKKLSKKRSKKLSKKRSKKLSKKRSKKLSKKRSKKVISKRR